MYNAWVSGYAQRRNIPYNSFNYFKLCNYFEFSLIHHNSFSKHNIIIVVDKRFGGLTGYPLVLANYYYYFD